MGLPKSRPTPETESHVSAQSADENGFIGSSQAVGAGHCDSDNRLPDPNSEWVNEESGEGLNGSKKGSW